MVVWEDFWLANDLDIMFLGAGNMDFYLSLHLNAHARPRTHMRISHESRQIKNTMMLLAAARQGYNPHWRCGRLGCRGVDEAQRDRHSGDIKCWKNAMFPLECMYM
jgi:hypothetical protein